MYGGDSRRYPPTFATLWDHQVGAIHGRIITSWSMAAVLGPQLVTYSRAYQRAHGVTKAEAYDTTLLLHGGHPPAGPCLQPLYPSGRSSRHVWTSGTQVSTGQRLSHEKTPLFVALAILVVALPLGGAFTAASRIRCPFRGGRATAGGGSPPSHRRARRPSESGEVTFGRLAGEPSESLTPQPWASCPPASDIPHHEERSSAGPAIPTTYFPLMQEIQSPP